jgi:hypothetical protein
MKRFRHGLTAGLGTVFGLVGLFGLVLLAPIHHLHAVVLDLGKTHSGQHGGLPWHYGSAANPEDPPSDEPARPPIRCPICTLVESATSLLPPTAPAVVPTFAVTGTVVALPVRLPIPRRFDDTARPRAPPTRV